MKAFWFSSIAALLAINLAVAADTTNSTSAPAGSADAAVTARAKVEFDKIGDELDKDSDLPSPTSATWQTADDKITAFGKEFGPTLSLDGKTPAFTRLRHIEMAVRQAASDPGYEAFLQKLAADPDPGIAEMAKSQMAKEAGVTALESKPLDLKFVAVDGRSVDFTALRGKVVLLDFWATWCPPCREEVPKVVATYAKYHGQGFEIVGISLDKDKQKLMAFTKAQAMPWPQYFDGKVWENEISSKYGIDSIPAMWLIDKQGLLVTTQAQEKLADQVPALLKK